MAHVHPRAGVILALLLIAAAPQSKDGKPTWGDWNAWNHFPEGAWVTIERDFRGEFKTSYSNTLAKKTADKLTVKISDDLQKDDKPAEDQPTVIIEGPLFGQGDENVIEKNPKPFPCPTCRAEHRPSVVTEQKKEKLKVGGKEILCNVMDVVPFDCRGAKSGTSRWWLSKEVPGGLVKREWTAIDKPGKVIDTVVGFDKQNKVSSEGK
jgi:hypothetical protein